MDDEADKNLVKKYGCYFIANYQTLLQDSVSAILRAVSSIPSCKLIEETCERKIAMHFDYCTTASVDFVLLDETAFSSIIRVSTLPSLGSQAMLS